ncbi:TetR/AcrR family transcriptional regulator [Phytohabitans aurantiacus]|jgi:AcrR family transcriptional regulator|uniref:TetR family transcriptional regulator n=1 Tax=Phytohabitans aurantiacus TaxID=3016789 RepID=A0ABQ5R9Q8_9ACTN|nr:TetR/AcrR family transcriptional regulator [Phytohabitans aurantiacus]GLI03484.1 TetR family transcriptional regulator [Phytohabitans aurantiacus]
MPKVSDAYLAARRQQILDAAAACFARDGFHRTSMQDIVRESGISAGLVYRYFASKDDMITAIVADWHEQRQARLTAVDDADGMASAYLQLLRSVGDPATRDDLRLGVQVWAEAVRSPAIRELARRGVDGPRAAAAALIRDRWRDPDIDPDSLARVFVAIYQGLVLQSVWDETVDNDAFVRTLARLVETSHVT